MLDGVLSHACEWDMLDARLVDDNTAYPPIKKVVRRSCASGEKVVAYKVSAGCHGATGISDCVTAPVEETGSGTHGIEWENGTVFWISSLSLGSFRRVVEVCNDDLLSCPRTGIEITGARNHASAKSA